MWHELSFGVILYPTINLGFLHIDRHLMIRLETLHSYLRVVRSIAACDYKRMYGL
jgi:hypothetical protein